MKIKADFFWGHLDKLFLTLALIASPSFAQERVLEEVIVTAQKRAQSLQDVAVSVVARSGDYIEDRGVESAEDMSVFIPNYSVTQDTIGDKINIRGIQSGNNAGLEQSVSTFVDGVYRGRGVQSRFAFLDVERVEVLRGPQGAVFGKNTIGGALNITTAKPTDEFDYSISAEQIFEGIEQTKLTGFVSGSLSDTARVRLAGLYQDQSEGFLTNVYHDEIGPQFENSAVRGTFEFDLSPETLLTVRAETGDFSVDMQPFSLSEPGPLAIFEALLGIPSYPGSTEFTNMGSSNPVLSFGSNGIMDGDSTEIMTSLVQDFDSGKLTAIAAYSEYQFDRSFDADLSILDMVRFDDSEDYEQTSLELRFESDNGNGFEYIVGGYYQDAKLYAGAQSYFNVRQGDATNEIAFDTFFTAGCNYLVSLGADPATQGSCIYSGAMSAFDGTPLEYQDFNRINQLDQDSELYAIFTQLDFDLSDELTASLSLRYSNEEKTATQTVYAADFGTTNRNDAISNFAAYEPFLAMGLADIFTLLGEATPHTHDLSRDETPVTWSANLNWTPNEDVLLYAKAASGFKAGGYNSFALSADPAEAEYEEEEVLGFELGAKLSLLDGAGELNIAAFTSEFQDIQSAVFTGATAFIVQNAAEATSSGLELDARFAATDALTVGLSAAYVNFEYDSFPNAACYFEQLVQFRLDNAAPLATLRDCSAAEINDLSGRTSENTPEYSAALSLDHEAYVGDYRLNTLLDFSYQDEQYRQGDLDPFSLQDAYLTTNLSLIVGPEEGKWDVSLLVNNLFDEDAFSYVNDIPAVEGARTSSLGNPRTVGLRFRLRH